MAKRNFIFSALSTAVLIIMLAPAQSQDIAVSEKDIKVGQKNYSPYLYQSYPNRVFWVWTLDWFGPTD